MITGGAGASQWFRTKMLRTRQIWVKMECFIWVQKLSAFRPPLAVTMDSAAFETMLFKCSLQILQGFPIWLQTISLCPSKSMLCLVCTLSDFKVIEYCSKAVMSHQFEIGMVAQNASLGSKNIMDRFMRCNRLYASEVVSIRNPSILSSLKNNATGVHQNVFYSHLPSGWNTFRNSHWANTPAICCHFTRQKIQH